MNIYEILFIMVLVVLIGITLAKIYNLFNAGEFYTLPMAVLLFITYSLLSLIALVITLFNASQHFYSVMLNIIVWGGTLNILFLIAEVVFTLKDFIVKPIESYKPNR